MEKSQQKFLVSQVGHSQKIYRVAGQDAKRFALLFFKTRLGT
jgi:hypothetical protein